MLNRSMLFSLSLSLTVHGAVIGVGCWLGHRMLLPHVAVEGGTGAEVGDALVVGPQEQGEVADGITLTSAEVNSEQPIDQPSIDAELGIANDSALAATSVQVVDLGEEVVSGGGRVGAFQESISTTPYAGSLGASGGRESHADGMGVGANGNGIAAGGPIASSRNKPPEYPSEARRLGYEGVVILRILVNEDGSVEKAEIVTSCGHDILDRAAIEGVRKWIFDPAKIDGRPQRCEIKVPVQFVLRQ